ncbi:MAG: glycosyltransferase [Alphaproteobacteria bacterium]|nr:glycosyltransferase [Alphaproteobacteria bacterium]
MSEVQEKPRRLMMIGYNTVDELIRDGKIRFDDPVSLELQFNLGRMFDEVIYVVPFGRENIERRIDETTIYRELAFDRSERGLKLVLNGLKHIAKARAFMDECVARFKPDVVQTIGPHIPAAMALLSPLTRALPTICMVEAYWEDILPFQQYFPKSIKTILPYWYRIAYRLFDRYTGAPSLSPPYYISKGMDEARISPWIQPLDLREVEGADAADAPDAVKAAAYPRIVVLGRLHPEKLAVDAFDIFAKAVAGGLSGSLIFVGDGLDRPIIESRAKELGLSDRVVITGLVPHKQAMSILKACDLSIAPMQGSALLETLAAGIATVAYDHETHAALITSGENGVLVPHRDVVWRPCGRCCFGPLSMRLIFRVIEIGEPLNRVA